MAHNTEEPYWLQEQAVPSTQTSNPLAAGTNNNGNNGPVYRPNYNNQQGGKTEDTNGYNAGTGTEQVIVLYSMTV